MQHSLKTQKPQSHQSTFFSKNLLVYLKDQDNPSIFSNNEDSSD